MAEVVQLKVGEKPPEDEDWLTIEAAGEAKYLISTCLRSAEKSASFGMMGPFETRGAALEVAQERAQRWGLPVIYRKG